MGGHGALICAMKNPGMYKSVSAFAPISNPINAPWGKKAFSGYLGKDEAKWKVKFSGVAKYIMSMVLYCCLKYPHVSKNCPCRSKVQLYYH